VTGGVTGPDVAPPPPPQAASASIVEAMRAKRRICLMLDIASRKGKAVDGKEKTPQDKNCQRACSTSSAKAEGCVTPWRTVCRARRGGESSVAMSRPVLGLTLMKG